MNLDERGLSTVHIWSNLQNDDSHKLYRQGSVDYKAIDKAPHIVKKSFWSSCLVNFCQVRTHRQTAIKYA